VFKEERLHRSFGPIVHGVREHLHGDSVDS